MRCGRYAAIDIGTVTCRMLVVDADESGLRELTREYAITNLGEGVDATGELKPEAIDRVVRAIDGFLAVRDSLSTPDHPVVRTVAVATSAARDARNAADFAARLRERGIELSVIPGSREAALSFSGASIDFPGERLMVVDVGGGSTEVVMGTGGAEPLCAHSFNVGCRRVTEKFLASDPPALEELARARAWIREQMASWFADQAKEAALLERVVAVAGTATTVVSIRERMETYDSSRVHKALVSRQDLLEVYERLAVLPLSERMQVVGLDPKRAPVMVVGLLILLEVLDFAGIDAFTVSETDILHGITLAVSHEACEKSCL
ncbi:Ppx/GppA family phosphatase [uncultured Ellagibacter sp.]|uniref:Ppx/GppA phosphatase family protein n=1 Tax=uncultured Ellagibacter sp. TaxID=2137580 RepID=UPI002600BE8E|nr:Ppx/GppA family phosphatase [uncultured Ellagibacter sp.]